MTWLVDTNVISETIKAAPNPDVTRWLSEREDVELHMSVVTLAELRLGIAKLEGKSRQRAAVHASWLRGIVRPLFASRVLPVDEEVAFVWRRLFQEGKSRGRPFDAADLLLAATAIVHDLTVATRDVSQYQAAGALTFNPWEDKRE
jgi:predicted nucleic acid-binding protein